MCRVRGWWRGPALAHALRRIRKKRDSFEPRFFYLEHHLFFTHLAAAAKEQCYCRQPNEHIHYVLERSAGNASEERVYEIPIEKSYKSPVYRTDPHEYFGDLVNAARAFAHHSDD